MKTKLISAKDLRRGDRLVHDGHITATLGLVELTIRCETTLGSFFTINPDYQVEVLDEEPVEVV